MKRKLPFKKHVAAEPMNNTITKFNLVNSLKCNYDFLHNIVYSEYSLTNFLSQYIIDNNYDVWKRRQWCFNVQHFYSYGFFFIE